jgi:hypothetical protein
MLRIEVLATPSYARLAEPTLAQIDRLVSWQEPPHFEKIGRSALLSLEPPLSVETPRGRRELHTVKLKGVGLHDHRGERFPPSVAEHHRIHPHLGFTPAGDLVSVCSRAAPLGGITLPMARSELEIGLALLAAGCPTQVPLRLYRYDEPCLVFRPSDGTPAPLGAIVSGFPSRSRIRAHQLFEDPGHDEATRRERTQWAEQLGVPPGAGRELGVLTAVARRYGRALRRFHAAGFYRYSGQPDNYAYAPEHDEVFLIDLDSSRPLAECTAATAPFQLLRDGASALYGLTAYMLRRLHWQRFPPAAVARSGLYSAWLQGYFAEVELTLREEVAWRLGHHYDRVHTRAAEIHATTPPPADVEPRELDYATYRRQRRQQTWIARDESFCFFLLALWNLLAASELGKSHPYQRTQQELLASVARYDSPATARYVSEALEPLSAAAR